MTAAAATAAADHLLGRLLSLVNERRQVLGVGGGSDAAAGFFFAFEVARRRRGGEHILYLRATSREKMGIWGKL